MKRMLAALAGALFLIGCNSSDATAQDDTRPISDSERARVEQIVRDYILEHPELIEEALIELQRRARQREIQAYVAAIEANA